MELVKLPPVYQYSVDIIHVLVSQEYTVLTERKIPLKSVLRCMRIVAPSISSHETESVVFKYCRFSLFLKDSFLQII